MVKPRKLRHEQISGDQVPTVSEALPSLLPEHHMSIQRGKEKQAVMLPWCCRVFDDGGGMGWRNMVFLISVLILSILSLLLIFIHEMLFGLYFVSP